MKKSVAFIGLIFALLELGNGRSLRPLGDYYPRDRLQNFHAKRSPAPGGYDREGRAAADVGVGEVPEYLILPPLPGPDAMAAEVGFPSTRQMASVSSSSADVARAARAAAPAPARAKRVRSVGFRCAPDEVWSRAQEKCVQTRPNGPNDDHLRSIALMFA